MQYLFAVVFFVLSFTNVDANTWQAKKVNVYDYTQVSLGGDNVSTFVQDYNARRPAGTPRLVLHTMSPTKCDNLKETWKYHAIIACEKDDLGAYWGNTTILTSHHHIDGARVSLLTTRGGPAVCHEFMHALTDIPDVPSDADGWYLYDHADSCVRGELWALGDYDIQYLAETYGGK